MSTPPDNYFTKEELTLLAEGMRWYASKRHGFASAIARKNYRTRKKAIATNEDIKLALDSARQCDTLLGKVIGMVDLDEQKEKEKVECVCHAFDMVHHPLCPSSEL